MLNDGNTIGHRPVGMSASVPWSLRAAACYLTIAACLPYLTLKVLWLSGRSIGATDAAGAATLTDPRHIVGNLVTVGMELVAIGLVLALTYSWGRRLPAALVLVPVWVGTGLLAPLVLGLPLGLVAEAVGGGAAAPADNGLAGWVFAVVYGGFIVQAVGLLTAFLGYALDRWPQVFWIRTPQLGASTARQRRRATVAATVAAGYAVLLGVWTVAGPRWGGPEGFDAVAQRTVLLATGLVVLGGTVAVLALLGRWGTGRILVPLVVAWLGTGVIVTSGPTHVALSHEGNASVLLVTVALAATVAGLLLTASALRVLTPAATTHRG